MQNRVALSSGLSDVIHAGDHTPRGHHLSSKQVFISSFAYRSVHLSKFQQKISMLGGGSGAGCEHAPHPCRAVACCDVGISGDPPPCSQGSKFSDFSLISDFFPTPRTILDFSVNLKRKNSFEGEGVGLLEYSDPKWHWNAPFATPEARKFLGEDPQATQEEDVSFAVHLTNTCMHHQAQHYSLSDFLVETHFDPCTLHPAPSLEKKVLNELQTNPRAPISNGLHWTSTHWMPMLLIPIWSLPIQDVTL